MTQLRPATFHCPQCNENFRTIVEDSINVELDPSSLESIIKEGYLVECENCHQRVPVNWTILISGSGFFFPLSTGDPRDAIIQKLREHGVIDEHDNVITQGFRRGF